MFNYVLLLAAVCVCQLSDAEQVMYSVFLEIYLWKQLSWSTGKGKL